MDISKADLLALVHEYTASADVNRSCVRPRRGSKDPHNLFNQGAAAALDDVVKDLLDLVDPPYVVPSLKEA